MAFLRNHDRRVAAKHFLLAVGARLDVVRIAALPQQLEPFGREDVRMNINNRHAGSPKE
ncbi:hypothetical protein OKW43_004802 [Paraburkholderia sp. WC7.3g]|uniref:hypothetical protein n=1 Tax=Paraburkholderia TaxID=1822464 RepID=UPI001FE7DCC7|nr:hypothetical protein [Paraburkholderia podalyriae]